MANGSVVPASWKTRTLREKAPSPALMVIWPSRGASVSLATALKVTSVCPDRSFIGVTVHQSRSVFRMLQRTVEAIWKETSPAGTAAKRTPSSGSPVTVTSTFSSSSPASRQEGTARQGIRSIRYLQVRKKRIENECVRVRNNRGYQGRRNAGAAPGASGGSPSRPGRTVPGAHRNAAAAAKQAGRRR